MNRSNGAARLDGIDSARRRPGGFKHIPLFSAMLIGLDAIPLTEPKTGVGHYTFELARALAAACPADQFELMFPSSYAPVELSAAGDAGIPHNLRTARVPVGVLTRHWWSLGLPRYARQRGVELFHGTNYDVPLRATCATVLTVHDLSAYSHPDTHLPARARRLRRRLPLMTRAADAIITPTESVRGELCARLSVDPSKVFVVPEAPREVFRPLAQVQAREAVRALGVEGDFFLAVGTVEPRKNLLTLVRAFETLTRSESLRSRAGTKTGADGVRLVVAGQAGWLSDQLYEHVAQSPARGRLHFTGYVSDETLRALYSACLALVYPSHYEGFGLPPLEAMACGAPVVASSIPALDETLGRGATLGFPPSDADALADRLSQLLADPPLRAALSEAGSLRAAEFSWERAARQTMDVYLRAVSSRARA